MVLYVKVMNVKPNEIGQGFQTCLKKVCVLEFGNKKKPKWIDQQTRPKKSELGLTLYASVRVQVE